MSARSSRRRVGWWAAIAAALVLAIGALWSAGRHREPPPAPPVVQSPAPPAVQPLPPPAVPQPPPVEASRTAVRKAVPAPPPADGQVMLAIAPWGEVLVNGEPRGVSPPLTRMSLPPGSYAIEVRNGNSPPLKTSIEIKPGQTQTLRHRF